MDFYKGVIPIINDEPGAMALAFPGRTGSPTIGYGYVPRDYAVDPPEMFAGPGDMSLIPESEWDARYEEEEKIQSSLEHLFLRGGSPAFVNLDQNGHGYCWSYSAGSALMMCRLRDNLPAIRLNPHSVAAIIKRGADEGGWCGLSARFARENGMAEEGSGPGQWPLHSRNLSNDNPACRERMKMHRIERDWIDLTRSAYDDDLTIQQYATRLLSNDPCPSDFNWWGHSVCAIRWVRIERGSWGPLILNSWKGWGRHGLGVLQGSKGRPDGALAIASSTPSM